MAILLAKSYRDAVEVLRGELDCFPFYALLPEEDARYYLATSLLSWIGNIEYKRKIYPIDGISVTEVHTVFVVEYLKRETVIAWIHSQGPLRYIVTGILDEVVNTTGFEYSKETLMEIRYIRETLICDPEPYGA